ncbi:GNAT family N-acetyltransferase [Paenibacillus sp. SAF-068]|uniref:GNAT family N-acetyltransferase n=1 Tax=Paenibacillus sp. SAF-068 TaxID=3436864 RepID=UPI003F7F79FA
MSLKIEYVNKSFHEMNSLKELYDGAFPEEEKLPMWFLLWKARKSYIHFVAFYDDLQFIGFTYLIEYKDTTFIFYLAIDTKNRSKGYGSQILSKIKEMYPNNRIILNIEVIDEAASNYEQRVSRKRFYVKNGYRSSNRTISQFNQSYEVMIHGKDLVEDELRSMLKLFAGTILYWFSRTEIN